MCLQTPMEAATSPVARSVAGEAGTSPGEPRLNSDLTHGNLRPVNSETGTEMDISRSSNTNSALKPHTSPGSDKAIEETQVAQQNDDAAITPSGGDMNFKPLILTPVFLISSLLFHFLVLGMLIALALNPEFTVLSEWGYFFVQILPPTIGTITASFLRGVTLALSRLEPFIQCASKYGSTAGKTILRQYFPATRLRDILGSGNLVLISSWLLFLLSGFILAFKASLLSMTSDWDVTITTWSLYPLLAIYGSTIIFTVALMYKLANIQTGLRWDPVSIADHLVLLRHSDFLDKFEGTDIANRASILHNLQHLKIRLGYWRLDNGELWHGFRLSPSSQDATVPDHHPAPSMPALRESGPGVNEKEMEESHLAPITFKAEEIERMRYRAVYTNIKPAAMLIWTALTIILIGLYIAALACGMVSGIQLPFSPGVASFFFSFLLTFIVSQYTWFWEDVDMFFRSTQPFAGLSHQKLAAENLLLDYNCLLPGLVTCTALKNKHWKVAGASVLALLQRLLPIIVAGSVSIQWHNDGSVVSASLPLIITTMVWLVAYVLLIPVFLTGNSDRYLPRNYLSISDLISWTYASKLLRDDHSDPLLGSGNPLDVADFGPESKQWHAKARLRLAKKEYAFWMYNSTTHPGKYCLGIDETSNMEAILPQTQPEVGPKVLGMRRRNKNKADVEEAVTPAKDYPIMRNPNLTLLLDTSAELVAPIINMTGVGPHAHQEEAVEEETDR